MFRKTMIALAAIGALSATAMAPTAASAKGWGKGFGGYHGHYHGYHGRYGRVGLGLGLVGAGIAYNSCMQRRWIDTPYGARLRWVNVCF